MNKEKERAAIILIGSSMGPVKHILFLSVGVGRRFGWVLSAFGGRHVHTGEKRRLNNETATGIVNTPFGTRSNTSGHVLRVGEQIS